MAYSSDEKKNKLDQCDTFNELKMSIILVPKLLANEALLKRAENRPGKAK